MYGSHSGSCRYSYTLELYKEFMYNRIASVVGEIETNENRNMYELHFGKKIRIEQRISYTVVLSASGNSSWKGINGKRCVRFGNKNRVIFEESEFLQLYVQSVINIKSGQIPGLLLAS